MSNTEYVCSVCGQSFTEYHFCNGRLSTAVKAYTDDATTTTPPLSIERLRKLKELVNNGLYQCDFHQKIGRLRTTYTNVAEIDQQDADDLRRLIEQEIEKQEERK